MNNEDLKKMQEEHKSMKELLLLLVEFSINHTHRTGVGPSLEGKCEYKTTNIVSKLLSLNNKIGDFGSIK